MSLAFLEYITVQFSGPITLTREQVDGCDGAGSIQPLVGLSIKNSGSRLEAEIFIGAGRGARLCLLSLKGFLFYKF
jgi:hypothetical protein